MANKFTSKGSKYASCTNFYIWLFVLNSIGDLIIAWSINRSSCWVFGLLSVGMLRFVFEQQKRGARQETLKQFSALSTLLYHPPFFAPCPALHFFCWQWFYTTSTHPDMAVHKMSHHMIRWNENTPQILVQSSSAANCNGLCCKTGD